MKEENEFVEDCRIFVEEQIAKLSPEFEYHSIEHTKFVLKAVNTLAEFEGIKERDAQLLQIAALFHDIGFARDIINHEAASVWMAGDFLKYRMKPSEIVTIEHLILTTAPGVVPMNLCEKIIKDADLSYLGTDDFEYFSSKLRNEWVHTRHLTFTDENWMRMNIRFLKETNYHTETAKRLFGPLKDANLKKMTDRLKA